MFFRADLKKQNGCPGLSSAEIIQLFLWNHWTEFNETWQEPRSQHPLPSLRFFGQSVNKNGHPGWSFKKVAHCTQVHVMWPFGPLVSQYRTFHENFTLENRTHMTLLRKWDLYRENYPCMKGLANNFTKFSPSKNNHVYSNCQTLNTFLLLHWRGQHLLLYQG